VKKVYLVVAVAALCGLAASTFADVQNIRLSGDIRVQGYYMNGTGNDGTTGKQSSDEQFITQRTRVSVEADLEDHVLVVVTLQADGIWGQNSSPALLAAGNKGWTVGLDEAYVQLRELFYSPATLKVGRQYLNYGSGLIISSSDLTQYNFDAGRLVLDYHPLTIDVVAAQLANGQLFTSRPAGGGQSDLLFVNAKYDGGSSALKTVEAYVGWVNQTALFPVAGNTAIPPTFNGSSPIILGLRTDLAPTEGLTASLEGAYELGNADGINSTKAKDISSFIAKAAVTYTMKGVAWTPAFNADYTYAQGGGTGGRHNFVPWFDGVDNGVLFGPVLSDVQIFNLGASVKPCANTTLALEGFYYLKADSKTTPVFSNPNYDFGGLGYAAVTGHREIGYELDAVAGYDYSKDVRLQLVYAAFIPQYNGGISGGDSRVANEVRGELNVKF